MPKLGDSFLPGEKMPKLLGYAVDPPQYLIRSVDDWPSMSQIGNQDIRQVMPNETVFVKPDKDNFVVHTLSTEGQYPKTGGNYGKFNNQKEAEDYAKWLQIYANAGVEKPYSQEAAKKQPSSGMPIDMVARGNIDLDKRQVGADFMPAQHLQKGDPLYGQTVLIPLSIDGTQMSEDEAIKRYTTTGEHLGRFKGTVGMDEFAQRLVERFQSNQPPARGWQIQFEASNTGRPGDLDFQNFWKWQQ